MTARDLSNRKEILNQLQSSITNEFRLKKIRVGSQQGQSMLSVSDVLEQIDSLKIVQVLPAAKWPAPSKPFMVNLNTNFILQPVFGLLHRVNG